MLGLSRQYGRRGRKVLRGRMLEWTYYKMKTNQLTKFLERDLLSKAIRNALLKSLILAFLYRPELMIGKAITELAP